MDFAQMMMDALRAGFKMDEKGELKGDQTNWMTMQFMREQDQLKQRDNFFNNPMHKDWF